MTPARRSGEVITFYSYKGGAGRSMALANVAVSLAGRRSGKILMIDWDLEAPGLHRFFRGRLLKEPLTDEELLARPGLIDWFLGVRDLIGTGTELPQSPDEARRTLEGAPFGERLIECAAPGLHMLTAGRIDSGYGGRVNTFDWAGLHESSPWLFTELAALLSRQYRYVLIDSRTGLTDTSGICTTLLPEKLALVFTPNRQSLTGLLPLVRQATTYRQESDDIRRLTVYPVASRVEMSEEELRYRWRFGDTSLELPGYQRGFEAAFEAAYGLAECKLGVYFDEIQIQHSPFHAYGEEIAVLDERIGDRLSVAASYTKLADALAEDVLPWEMPRPEEAAQATSTFDERASAVTLRRLDDLLVWYDRTARRNQRYYQATTLLAILAATATAVGGILAATNTVPPTLAIAAGAITFMSVATQVFFTFQRNWLIYRTMAEELRREQHLFLAGAGEYAAGQPERRLAERVEATVASERASPRSGTSSVPGVGQNST